MCGGWCLGGVRVSAYVVPSAHEPRMDTVWPVHDCLWLLGLASFAGLHSSVWGLAAVWVPGLGRCPAPWILRLSALMTWCPAVGPQAQAAPGLWQIKELHWPMA